MHWHSAKFAEKFISTMKQVLLFLTCFLSGSLFVNAQFIADPMSNKPFYSFNGDINGNPLIFKGWNNGTIRTARGVVYTNIKLNYDATTNTLLFNINDSMFRFAEPAKEFTIDADKPGMPARKFVASEDVHDLLPRKFVQVLAEGQVQLYKHYKKNLIEVSDYNSAGRKVVEEKITYHVVRNGVLTPVVLGKKALQELLNDRWKDVDGYISQNNISVKSEEGWIKVITFYNSLF